MTDSASPPASTQGKKSPGKVQKFVNKVGVTLGVALVVFLIGWMVGRSPIGAVRDRAEQAETKLALVQDHQYMTEAAMLLYRAALDLDARNFGTANDRLDQAASVLDSVGVAGSELEDLRTGVSSMDINVALDLAGQRAAVLDFAETLQGLLHVEEETSPAQPIEADSTIE